MKKQSFAKLIGITPQHLSKILGGGETSIKTAKKMAGLLRYKDAGAIISALQRDPVSVSAAIMLYRPE